MHADTNESSKAAKIAFTLTYLLRCQPTLHADIHRRRTVTCSCLTFALPFENVHVMDGSYSCGAVSTALLTAESAITFSCKSFHSAQ